MHGNVLAVRLACRNRWYLKVIDGKKNKKLWNNKYETININTIKNFLNHQAHTLESRKFKCPFKYIPLSEQPFGFLLVLKSFMSTLWFYYIPKNQNRAFNPFDSEADQPKLMREEEGGDNARQRKQRDAAASACVSVLTRNRSYAVLLDMLRCMPSCVLIGLWCNRPTTGSSNTNKLEGAYYCYLL